VYSLSVIPGFVCVEKNCYCVAVVSCYCVIVPIPCEISHYLVHLSSAMMGIKRSQRTQLFDDEIYFSQEVF
jgi:hypothetical protein